MSNAHKSRFPLVNFSVSKTVEKEGAGFDKNQAAQRSDELEDNTYNQSLQLALMLSTAGLQKVTSC